MVFTAASSSTVYYCIQESFALYTPNGFQHERRRGVARTLSLQLQLGSEVDTQLAVEHYRGMDCRWDSSLPSCINACMITIFFSLSLSPFLEKARLGDKSAYVRMKSLSHCLSIPTHHRKKRRYLDLELPYFALQQVEHRSLASWQTLTRRHMRQPGSTYSNAHTSEYSTKLQTYLPVWHHQRARIRVCKLPKSAAIHGRPLKFQTIHTQIDLSMHVFR